MRFEYEPAGQIEHEVNELSVVFPGPQLMHWVMLPVEYDPVVHVKHAVASVARFAYDPAPHVVQLAALDAALIDPGVQAWQLTFPLGVNDPAVHDVQMVALSALNDPVAQVLHCAVALAANVPALHIVHTELLPRL